MSLSIVWRTQSLFSLHSALCIGALIYQERQRNEKTKNTTQHNKLVCSVLLVLTYTFFLCRCSEATTTTSIITAAKLHVSGLSTFLPLLASLSPLSSTIITHLDENCFAFFIQSMREIAKLLFHQADSVVFHLNVLVLPYDFFFLLLLIFLYDVFNTQFTYIQ